MERLWLWLASIRLSVLLWQLTHSYGGDRAGRGKIARRWNGDLPDMPMPPHMKQESCNERRQPRPALLPG